MDENRDMGRFSGKPDINAFDAMPQPVTDAMAALGMWATELLAENKQLREACKAWVTVSEMLHSSWVDSDDMVAAIDGVEGKTQAALDGEE